MRFIFFLLVFSLTAQADPAAFFEQHCVKCHDSEVQKGNLDLTALKMDDLADAEKFARWVKIHDRIQSGEMPPKKEQRPEAGAVKALVGELAKTLIQAERGRLDQANRTSVRRMTRVEYQHTMRDLFHMPGIALQMMLPEDGSAHGFDTNADALDVSHVNLSRYLEAADKTLDMAIAVQPEAPPVESVRLSLARNYMPDIMLMQGDAMLFRDKKIDPEFPPAGEYAHINQGAHESIGMFDRMSSVGVFRHEDESFSSYFQKFVVVHPGMYRAKASFWSLWWDKGQILPARGVEAARLSVVQFNENGRGGTASELCARLLRCAVVGVEDSRVGAVDESEGGLRIQCSFTCSGRFVSRRHMGTGESHHGLHRAVHRE
jgi:hypothetical protein